MLVFQEATEKESMEHENTENYVTVAETTRQLGFDIPKKEEQMVQECSGIQYTENRGHKIEKKYGESHV